LSDPPCFDEGLVDDDDQELERAFDRAFLAMATPAPPMPVVKPAPTANGEAPPAVGSMTRGPRAEDPDPWSKPSRTFTQPDARGLKVPKAPVELDPSAFADILHGEIIVGDKPRTRARPSASAQEDPTQWRDDPALRWMVYPKITNPRKQDRRTPRSSK